MKVNKELWKFTHTRSGYPSPTEYFYAVTLPSTPGDGWYPHGITGHGKSVASALADARHNYRTEHDGVVEHGHCSQGRHHKGGF